MHILAFHTTAKILGKKKNEMVTDTNQSTPIANYWLNIINKMIQIIIIIKKKTNSVQNASRILLRFPYIT